MSTTRVLWGCGAGLLLAVLAARAAEARPRFYIDLREPEAAAGVDKGVLPEAARILEAELAKRQEVELHVKGKPMPGADELKRRKVRGIAMVVRLDKVAEELQPPREGRPFKQLFVTVAVSLLGTEIPSQQMALGGDGESTVGTEVSRGEVSARERQELRGDALRDAMVQAVQKAFAKLAEGEKAPRKRRRRRK